MQQNRSKDIIIHKVSIHKTHSAQTHCAQINKNTEWKNLKRKLMELTQNINSYNFHCTVIYLIEYKAINLGNH